MTIGISVNKRLGYVDALKGFAIILVVLGHTLQNYYSDEALQFRLIYSFHMPLFMFLSGYCSYRIGSWNQIGKRFYQLIVPFFSAIVLTFLIRDFGHYTVGGLISNVVKVVCQPDLGLWFLWALFYINVIFLVCRKVAQFTHIHEVVIVLATAGVLNVIELVTHFELFGYHWIAWYFIYFATGVYWRTYLSTTPPHGVNALIYKTITICSYVLFLPAVYFFRMHNEAPSFYQWINLGSYFPVFYRLLVGFLGIGFCYGLFKQVLCSRWDFPLLCKMGTATLGIYYLHFFCLHQLFRIPLFDTLPVWLSVAIVTIITIIVCYFATRLCSHSKITRFLVLGENIFKSK